MSQYALRRAWPSLALAALLLFTMVFVGRALYFRNDIRFLAEHSPARWIIYPTPAFTATHPDVPLDAVFRRSFSLESIPAAAQLRVRAFRSCTIRLNENLLTAKFDSDHWKQESCIEVAQFLRTGQNDITVTVTNSSCPPALWLDISCPATVLITDKSWEVSLAGATWLPAALAADPVPFGNFDRDNMAERVLPSLLKIWPIWLIFAGVSLLILLLCHRWLAGGKSRGPDGQELPYGNQTALPSAAIHHKKRRNHRQRAEEVDRRLKNRPTRSEQMVSIVRSLLEPQCPHGRWVGLTRLLFVLIAVFWAALFLHNSQYLPPNCGFDADGHLGYINHFRTTWSVPLSGEGWQTHHPPLYHFLSALLLTVTGYAPDTANGILTIRLFNLVLALGNLFMILACLRLIFPEHPRRWVFGLLFTGFLPIYVYLYQYPTNHILAGTLASVTLYFTIRILCVPGSGIRDYVFLGLAMGLALLSIISVVLLVAPVGMALAAKAYADRAKVRWSRTALRFFILGAVLVGVCGWYYVRVWIHFGTPFVVNTGSGLGLSQPWWQDPGFRTWSDYLRFGESLRSPLFSVWYSVWDGLYSTLWGDSFCGGAGTLECRPPWSYDYMVAGMFLALAPTAAIILAGCVAIFQSLRKPTILWTFLIAVFFLVVFLLIYGAILVPYYCIIKASYGLAASVPLCVLAALGFDLLSGRWRWLRGVIFIVLGVWVLNVAASYWISPVSVETKRYLARQLLVQGKTTEAIGKLEQLLDENPDDNLTRVLLAQVFVLQNLDSRARQVLAYPTGQRDLPSRHLLLGVISAKEGSTKDALDELQRAMELAPNDQDLANNYAAILSAGPDVRAAIDASRNILRINPFSKTCHETLSKLYLSVGDQQSAIQHQDYVNRIK
jgi:hypothetical protein